MPALPSVAVVVPTRDRPQQLRACLESLARLQYPPERLEVLVVDDGGRLPVRPVVAQAAERLRVRLVEQPPSGPAVARNRGAAAADAELLAFTDDDCRPEPGWLAALAGAVTGGVAAGGRTRNALTANPYAEASQLLIAHLYEYFGAVNGRPRFLASNNLAVQAAAFRRAGGFDEKLPRAAAEDREFCDRWLASGGALAYVPAAVVVHAHDLDLAGFARQHFNYGRGALYFHRARARRSGERLRLEPLAFYTGLLRRPLRAASGAAAWRSSALLAASQVANAAGFGWEAALSRLGRAPRSAARSGR